MVISCLDKGRWWRSVHGVVLCLNCQPPADPAAVAEMGTAAEAPLVHRTASRTPFDENRTDRPRDPQEAIRSGLPMLILRGDHTPEQVVAKGNRKKIGLPRDATHWCYVGDAVWTPIDRNRVAESMPVVSREDF